MLSCTRWTIVVATQLHSTDLVSEPMEWFDIHDRASVNKTIYTTLTNWQNLALCVVLAQSSHGIRPQHSYYHQIPLHFVQVELPNTTPAYQEAKQNRAAKTRASLDLGPQRNPSSTLDVQNQMYVWSKQTKRLSNTSNQTGPECASFNVLPPSIQKVATNSTLHCVVFTGQGQKEQKKLTEKKTD